jgi:hypothetical protein
MKLPRLLAPADLPSADARVPGVAVRVALVIAGVLLSLLDYGLSGWLVVGVLIAVVAAARPEYMLGWVLIVALAIGQLHHHAELTWRFLILVAGVHLLHVISMLALELPWRSWVEPAVFRAPLRRFLRIQVPTQLLAVVALLLLAPGHSGHRPLTVAEFSVIGAVALAGLAMLLLGPSADEGR